MFRRKVFPILLLVALIVPILSVNVVGAQPPGCPDGFFPMMSAELEAACNGEYAGTVVTIVGTQDGNDAVQFQNSFQAFMDWTGIIVVYTGSKQFEGVIAAQVAGGRAPDMADFPQPGLLDVFTKQGKVVDISTFMHPDWLTTNYTQAWLDLAMRPGPDGEKFMAGVWARNSVKSLVWYPKQAWDAAGYQVPETWDEMLALSDQIVADGGTPWCIGIESGAATGWPGTDWIEDIMLRTAPLEAYDNWTVPATPADRVKFTDPIVKNAFEVMGNIWFNDAYVAGGTQSIAGTAFGSAPLGLFTDPPECYMHRQATFITSFFPTDPPLVAGVDYDFFYLPPIDPAYGRPVLGAADIMAMFNDRPEVRATMDWLSRGESVKTWLADGSTLAPQNDVDPAWFANDIQRRAAEVVAQATSFRFDGSDIMPAAVGAGTFWKGITNWVSGTTDLDTTLEEIDAGWPAE
ncbi:MAG: alpha-glucoside ABC transporter substrate-binding protein [Chloroflexota bacterium]|nr:MAG: alpha-glucoside ABC transporter substrate-binding protein [Chloroflexota bacterium]